MALTVQNIRDSYERFKQDISDVDDEDFSEWCQFIVNFTYERLKNQDPERFMLQYPYAVVTDPDTFALQSDFMDMRQMGCGFHEITEASLAYDGQTVNFTVGNSILGATSGATAIITADDDDGTSGTLTVDTITGTFVDNEVISETGSGTGSATANGAPVYTTADNVLGETSFGSTDEGFYLTYSDVVFTGIEDKTFLHRYLPKPPTIDALTDYLTMDATVNGRVIIEDRHKEFFVKAVDVYYEQWDESVGRESVSDFRLVRALGEILSTTRRTPQVYSIDNPASSY